MANQNAVKTKGRSYETGRPTTTEDCCSLRLRSAPRNRPAQESPPPVHLPTPRLPDKLDAQKRMLIWTVATGNTRVLTGGLVATSAKGRGIVRLPYLVERIMTH
ncbi:hypothetical protein PoB_007043700 [Plakobranchus ocellatus]|uniref:Uncharacterized protein n=1 Tax=Plakobranchus ocellatus TaxID=259542 RepID=A0AAV4DI39_9GAST|nr:hypothetical protein PoB_007043700 [Plakobranchus ocellatus]